MMRSTGRLESTELDWFGTPPTIPEYINCLLGLAIQLFYGHWVIAETADIIVDAA